jgi:molybdenum cofactor cytidylyltransferase
MPPSDAPPEIPAVVPGLAAVVLAAGASSRMGRPKALLDFDGTPCVRRVLATCAEAGVATAVVVTAPGGDAVRAACLGAPLAVIEAVNDRPERGMLSSLQAGLRLLPQVRGFLLYPVDFPIVPAAEVRRLLEAFCARRDPRIFIPSFAQRRGHPVLIDAALAAEFLALRAEQSARAVIDGHPGEITYVAAADARVLMDMDTPEDYARCLQVLRAPPRRP